MKKELKRFQRELSSECSESQREEEEVLDTEEEEKQRSSRESLVKITQHFLRRMNQEKLADVLQSSKRKSFKT